jgi:hypothetical protein
VLTRRALCVDSVRAIGEQLVADIWSGLHGIEQESPLRQLIVKHHKMLKQ